MSLVKTREAKHLENLSFRTVSRHQETVCLFPCQRFCSKKNSSHLQVEWNWENTIPNVYHSRGGCGGSIMAGNNEIAGEVGKDVEKDNEARIINPTEVQTTAQGALGIE